MLHTLHLLTLLAKIAFEDDSGKFPSNLTADNQISQVVI